MTSKWSEWIEFNGGKRVPARITPTEIQIDGGHRRPVRWRKKRQMSLGIQYTMYGNGRMADGTVPYYLTLDALDDASDAIKALLKSLQDANDRALLEMQARKYSSYASREIRDDLNAANRTLRDLLQSKAGRDDVWEAVLAWRAQRARRWEDEVSAEGWGAYWNRPPFSGETPFSWALACDLLGLETTP